jgi:predicted outer membrane repeat protein
MRIGVGVAAAVLLALAGAPHAAAADFTVTRTDDPAPDGCMPMDCSLREAALDANATVGKDAILLPAGHFRLTIPGPGEDAGATGDLDLLDDVTIAGSGARLTSIDAQGLDRVVDVRPGISAEIDDVTITGGGTAGDGGGVENRALLTLVRDAILDNQATGLGGGIYSTGNLVVSSSSIARNQGLGGGGGIYVGGSAKIESSTISGNAAGGPGWAGYGGGIDSIPASLELKSSTLTGNQAFNADLEAGGIRSDAALVDNSIVADNVAHLTDQSGSAASNCGLAVQSMGHNLSDGTDCGFTQPGDQQGVPVQLGPLADNGGPTDTEAVASGSPALEAGAGCPATDQRGVSRPRGSACEIGAYELAPPLVTTTAATSVAFTTATMTGTVDPSLRETTAWFEYGRTPEYGSTTPVRNVGAGNGQVSFTEPLAGLRQGATYHYRLVAANAEGKIVGADQSFTTMDRAKPVLTLLRIVPGLFHRKNGVVFSFTLSENATVTLRFDHVLRGVRSGKRCVKITRRNRRHRPCTRYLPVAGSVVLDSAEGKNSMHFDARVGTKLLTFGAYRLRATPKDPSGNIGKTVVAAFRVLR